MGWQAAQQQQQQQLSGEAWALVSPGPCQQSCLTRPLGNSGWQVVALAFPTWTRRFFCSRVSSEEKLDLTEKGFQLWAEGRSSPGPCIRVAAGLNGKRGLINDPSCRVVLQQGRTSPAERSPVNSYFVRAKTQTWSVAAAAGAGRSLWKFHGRYLMYKHNFHQLWCKAAH